MKKLILVLLFPCLTALVVAQNKIEAEKLVDEGVAYHDKGDYSGAIFKYEKALELDKDNLLALVEKSFSLFSFQKYQDAIIVCKRAIEIHPQEKNLKTLYVTYGNAFDALKKTDEAIKIYDEGIEIFENYYQLYFNKGITLSSVKKYEDALNSFKKAVKLNPTHASSHNAISRLLYMQDKKIPSMLALSRFLVLETQTERAKENLSYIQKIIKGNVEQTGKNDITININSSALEDSTIDRKKKENNFNTTELIMSMSAALDYDTKKSKKSEVEEFIKKVETICSSLEETKKENFGFYWEYYVPYFIEMKNKNFIIPFSYIIFSSKKNETSKWLKSHQDEIDKFYEWDKGFVWNKN